MQRQCIWGWDWFFVVYRLAVQHRVYRHAFLESGLSSDYLAVLPGSGAAVV